MAEMSHPGTPGSSQANTPDDGRLVYEVGFHVLPTVAEAEVGAVVAKIHTLLGDAEIIKEEAPRKMTLAYTIERSVQGKREKYTEAYFGFIKFATAPEHMPALQAALRGMHEVLRFLIVETTREEAAAQPRRAVFTSDRLEGKTIAQAPRTAEQGGEVSEEELEKSIEALTQ